MPRKSKFDYEVIVIGSGAAGSTAALSAARSGMKVALVEGAAYGGESPHYGDVPIKAMLQAASLFGEAKAGARFGLRSSMLGYNFPTMQQWKNKAIRRSGSANNRDYYRHAGIDTYDAAAHFLTPHEITVNRTHLTADRFVIATGTQFSQPDVYGIEGIAYQTPRTILDAKRIPRSLFVVGSSSDALEYAQLFAMLGTKVYVSERANRILPELDSDVAGLVEQHFSDAYGISFLTQTQLAGVERKGLGTRVSFTRGQTTKSLQVDELLFLERSPLTDLGLENAKVDYTPAGIKVNNHLRTSAQHIYAGGGVIDTSASTQVAMTHGRVIAHNLRTKSQIAPDLRHMPRVVYTTPSIATVGLTDDDCLRRDLRTDTAVVPLSMIARANTSDNAVGFVKLIADKKGVLLGGTIVAPNAGDMIHEVALALAHGMTARDLAALPHAFLSWSEAVRIAATKIDTK